jgi:chorismate mutase/prephenate dehydrogenase
MPKPAPKRRTKRTGGSAARRTLLLVGGAGRMGRRLAPFFRKRGYRVLIADPAGRVPGFASADVSAAASADVVCVAASLDGAPAALEAVLAQSPRGLVFDIASLKTPLLPLFARARRAGVAIASTHPMFGPSSAFSGNDFLVLDCGDAAAAARVTRLFSGAGLRIRRMPVAEHDPWAARTMGLAHVAALACAGALVRLNVNAFDVDGRATTSFRRLLDLVGSLLDQDPALTRSIQTQNPDAPHAARVLAEELDAFRADLFAAEAGPLAARIGALRRALGRG